MLKCSFYKCSIEKNEKLLASFKNSLSYKKFLISNGKFSLLNHVITSKLKTFIVILGFSISHKNRIIKSCPNYL